ncbi:hypothetical protein [Actinomadura violacea]|uniref:DUF3592 domain-containing protein n=1 Tax=Actinomadura violacea TaxID=2819934 RepID=A0ABS3S1U4_9ACTN|nr:hypothetical protein [Actinomadura violacea]MBO2462932.1 hypothetical protein [Actinomadura violacea]
MPAALAAPWRAARTLGIAVLGLLAASAAYLWWSLTAAALLAIAGIVCGVVALAALYESRRPLRFKGVPLVLGCLALIALYVVGVVAARDVALTLAGTEDNAVVAKVWKTRDPKRTSPEYHCTLHRSDGTAIPREFASNCEGLEAGDTLPVVLDPGGRLPPVRGPKSEMSTTGELQAMAVAGLVVLVAVAAGSPPARERAARRT